MRVLVVDVGGNNIKILLQGQKLVTKIPSGPELTPRKMVAAVREATQGWKYNAVSLGCPGAVKDGRLVLDPVNLGKGWVKFDFTKAFGKPTRVINDAAMQALGSYEGGRMLFLGLGTGLGSALVINHAVVDMELAHLPYRRGKSFEYFLGTAGLKRAGRKRWEKMVHDVVERLRNALVADYVVLGGGNVKKLDKLPDHARRGNNHNAFTGGFRLWERRAKR